MGLDLDATGVEADERMRDSAREHPTQARLPGRRCLCRESAKRQYFATIVSGVTAATNVRHGACPGQGHSSKRVDPGGGGRLVRVGQQPRAATAPGRRLRAARGREAVQGQPERDAGLRRRDRRDEARVPGAPGPAAARSDLRLFDLATRRHLPIPRGIDTNGWECCAAISGDWLLFSRGHTYSSDRQLVLLRNLRTGEQRVLDTLRNRKGLVNAGQLNGTFAVWARCNPYPRCQVFRYDIATGSATALPVPAGKIPYAPAVNEYGTAYYMQSDRGCGKSVQLMKQRLTGPPELLTPLAAGPGRRGRVRARHHAKAAARARDDADLLRPAPVRKAFAAGHLSRRGHRPAPGSVREV